MGRCRRIFFLKKQFGVLFSSKFPAKYGVSHMQSQILGGSAGQTVAGSSPARATEFRASLGSTVRPGIYPLGFFFFNILLFSWLGIYFHVKRGSKKLCESCIWGKPRTRRRVSVGQTRSTDNPGREPEAARVSCPLSRNLLGTREENQT